MQTFLPYADFAQTARCLDRQRLGKQRVEAFQILQTLIGESTGWRHHPAVLMWKGHEKLLAQYGAEICKEWRRRGYKDQMYWRFLLQICRMEKTPFSAPEWLGDPTLHSSHRAALLAKNPVHYGTMDWTETPHINYVWPVRFQKDLKNAS